VASATSFLSTCAGQDYSDAVDVLQAIALYTSYCDGTGGSESTTVAGGATGTITPTRGKSKCIAVRIDVLLSVSFSALLAFESKFQAQETLTSFSGEIDTHCHHPERLERLQ